MPQYQFPRSHRLLLPQQFRRVFEQPQRAKSVGLMVLARGNDIGHARLGLAISKKSLPLAVQRNRIKRLARDVFRHRQHQLGGIDIVILSRHGLSHRSRPDIRNTLQQLLLDLASRCDQSS